MQGRTLERIPSRRTVHVTDRSPKTPRRCAPWRRAVGPAAVGSALPRHQRKAHAVIEHRVASAGKHDAAPVDSGCTLPIGHESSPLISRQARPACHFSILMNHSGGHSRASWGVHVSGGGLSHRPTPSAPPLASRSPRSSQDPQSRADCAATASSPPAQPRPIRTTPPGACASDTGSDGATANRTVCKYYPHSLQRIR